MLIELSDLSLCTSLYQEAFDHNQVIRPLGQALDPSLDTVGTPAAGFGFIEVLVLADLYNTVNQYEHAVDTIRRGCRWLQGRASQKFWDVCQDDREYDIPPEEGGAVRQRYDDLQPGFYVLDINARHRLAISRIKMGDMEEGKVCSAFCLEKWLIYPTL